MYSYIVDLRWVWDIWLVCFKILKEGEWLGGGIRVGRGRGRVFLRNKDLMNLEVIVYFFDFGVESIEIIFFVMFL